MKFQVVTYPSGYLLKMLSSLDEHTNTHKYIVKCCALSCDVIKDYLLPALEQRDNE